MSKRTTSGATSGMRASLFSAGGLFDHVALALENHTDGAADVFFVVNDKDNRGHALNLPENPRQARQPGRNITKP